ncbi:BTB/POZ domain-containing protein, partial [Ananas comosus]
FDREEMGIEKHKKSLTVAPFECAWHEELRFREAGRGCVAFEASAQNDVTLVFREHVGSQHYHYKMDNSPHYTVIFGSHRNRRLKIEVDGKTVVDVVGIGLCCSSAFQSYWISIYDGLISIGKGKFPFHNLVFQWLDSNPNCNVQYVGLSSWDKHVGYRNINVLPFYPDQNVLLSCLDCKGYDGDVEGDEGIDGFEKWGLPNFLESWDLADMVFVVGPERRAVPAHKVILGASGDFNFDSLDGNIVEWQLTSLQDLSLQFNVSPLIKQCEEIIDRFKMNKKLFDSGKKVEIGNNDSKVRQFGLLPFEVPVDVRKLRHCLATGEHSDIDIHVEGHGLTAKSHKVILSLWSIPFAKMFTNGMIESSSSEIYLRDVSAEAFSIMLEFMYSGELVMDFKEMNSLLLDLLLLSDQFAVTSLQRECCKRILECLSEDTVCPILRAISSIPSCKLLEETCKRNFSMHFDYCTTASTEFHADMTVTSEERVLDAIIAWCMQASEICGWTTVDELLNSLTPEQLFGKRLPSVDILLPLVRFPLMPSHLLERLENSRLSNRIPVFSQLVKEAIQYSGTGLPNSAIGQSVRFHHRRSSYKELQYIRDGDNNGVIYYAGTSYGEHEWVNPVLAKKISVTASSPPSRYTDPKALVSRTFQATFFAGPRMENGQICSWWMIDIGQDHQLMCNYYTLRQDGSTTFMRSWAFQGSMDGENWTNLRVHEKDQTICRSGQFASWPINGPTALLPFRFFRIILKGPSAADSNVWNLCICFIELYGYFR